jgi:alkylhydroperoxidase/carboxymuconolactone decarboxylase family protein YurZ
MNNPNIREVSNSFHAFLQEASGHAQAGMAAVKWIDEAGALDQKTEEKAYLVVLAAQSMESGIFFHVRSAKQAEATGQEVTSAILVGLPAVGQIVVQCLPSDDRDGDQLSEGLLGR